MNALYPQITSGLEYDNATHAYRLSGAPIPSVTQIIAAAGLVEGLEWMTDEHRQRGTFVHNALHFLAEGDLDYSSIAVEIQGYITGAQRFWSETGLEPIWPELVMAHPILKYGLKPDLAVAILAGEPLVIDYKTGAYAPHHAVQIAAYVEGVKANANALGLKPAEIPRRGLIVCLDKDGGYKIHDPRTERKPITHAQAWTTFLSSLNLYRFKETNYGTC